MSASGGSRGRKALGRRYATPCGKGARRRLGRSSDFPEPPYDAFGNNRPSFREREWKTPIFCGREVRKTPNASYLSPRLTTLDGDPGAVDDPDALEDAEPGRPTPSIAVGGEVIPMRGCIVIP